jgi:hypothetical protein
MTTGLNPEPAALTKYQCTKEGEILHVILTDKGNGKMLFQNSNLVRRQQPDLDKSFKVFTIWHPIYELFYLIYTVLKNGAL